MASFADLVQRLQPTPGRRGPAAKIDEGRVAAALMLAQDPRLAAATACQRCRVPSFRSRAKGMAKQIQQLGLQHVQLPLEWTASELAEAPQPQSHMLPLSPPAGARTGGRAHTHTLVTL